MIKLAGGLGGRWAGSGGGQATRPRVILSLASRGSFENSSLGHTGTLIRPLRSQMHDGIHFSLYLFIMFAFFFSSYYLSRRIFLDLFSSRVTIYKFVLAQSFREFIYVLYLSFLFLFISVPSRRSRRTSRHF